MNNFAGKSEIFKNDYLTEENKKLFADNFEALSTKQFSDILDGENNQYVNFVQQGGGVWGIALVGYLYALEIFGVRFLRLAGTSAGAINTILIAAIGKRNEPKSGKIKEILNNWELIEFVDGQKIVKIILKIFLYNKKIFKLTLGFILLIFLFLLSSPFIYKYSDWNIKYYGIGLGFMILILIFCFINFTKFVKHRFGLNPGNDFFQKLKKALEENEINSITDLNKKYDATGSSLNIRHRYGTEYFNNARAEIENSYRLNKEFIVEEKFKRFKDEINEKFSEDPLLLLRADYTIVTTDINSKIKVELPKMASLYWDSSECDTCSPAEFVRASMSIPIFFEPYIKIINKNDAGVLKAWEQLLNIKEPKDITREAVFIDGGSISNFPIDIFHERDVLLPRLPVFGVKLVDNNDKDKPYKSPLPKFFKTLPSYGSQIIDTIRSFNDNSFLMKYSFYNKYSISQINCHGSNWLNFDMNDEEKKKLYNKGFEAGIKFLLQFDWDQYKKDRMVVAFKERGVFKI